MNHSRPFEVAAFAQLQVVVLRAQSAFCWYRVAWSDLRAPRVVRYFKFTLLAIHLTYLILYSSSSDLPSHQSVNVRIF